MALALNALYDALTEGQQTDLRVALYRCARKHELSAEDEDAAMKLLEGY